MLGANTTLKILFENRAVKIDYNNIKYLCIADLHLGFELDYLRKGVRHIEQQSFEIIYKVSALLESHSTDVLLLLGDVKHTITRTTNYEKRLLDAFFEKIIGEKDLSVLIVRGNHDGHLDYEIPKKYNQRVKILSSLKLGKISLFHGHKKPLAKESQAPYWIMGHIHPSILLKDKFNNFTKEHVFLELNLSEQDIKSLSDNKIIENYLINKKILVLPPFNWYLAGYSLNLPRIRTTEKTKKELGYIGSIIQRVPELTKIYLLDGTYLTTLDKIYLK